ncbi:hypothetical protein OF83DRAFT_1161926 [Amylostereum chailletii]|nr:hypothetical protein OF83DRAFT_1161926 [Amylostereum chailletii]
MTLTDRSNHIDDRTDDNPRPVKRQRTDSSAPSTSSPLAALPPHVLLLSLPGLLVQPPTHPLHARSLHLSLQALRQCLALTALAPDIECRAWTGLAELGMAVIDGGFGERPEHAWATGIEAETEKAISKGHTSLRLYKYQQLTHARLAQWQHNSKLARTVLRRLLSSFTPHDPPALIYAAHLALIHHYASCPTTPPTTPSTSPSPPNPPRSSKSTPAQKLQTLATKNGHAHVALFAHVVRLSTLVSRGLWSLVPAALATAEGALGLFYTVKNDVATPTPTPTPTPSPATADGKAGASPQTFVAFDEPFEALLATHTLVLAVVFLAHAGKAAEVSPRLSHLHALLDAGVLDKFPDGIAQIALPHGPPLIVHTTHARVLYYIGYLASSAVKRDAVGRRPKRRVFAAAGLAAYEKGEGPGLVCPAWTSAGDVEEVEYRLVRIKADMLSELAGVSIMRSEFDAAEESLAELIAFARAHGLFALYAPRITLHHAHLAHALGQSSRAMQCYRVAAHLASGGGGEGGVLKGADGKLGSARTGTDWEFVGAAARAGEVLLRIGLGEDVGAELEETGREAVEGCRGMGGTLEAMGHVLEACLSPEILKSKQHLRTALELASAAQDNHMRALVLALITGHYMHTAGGHAHGMLETCEQLAAGLGAPASKEDAARAAVAGNAPLRLWVGERFVELYKRAGKEARAEKQAALNVELAKVVEAMASRPRGL